MFGRIPSRKNRTQEGNLTTSRTRPWSPLQEEIADLFEGFLNRWLAPWQSEFGSTRFWVTLVSMGAAPALVLLYDYFTADRSTVWFPDGYLAGTAVFADVTRKWWKKRR